jgi:predicted deacylase
MQIIHHPLPAPAVGQQRELLSWHFGTPGHGPKAYIQAALHADELPGMLVAHHLRQALQQLEQQQKIIGEVVLVPVANPIGLNQALIGAPFGRFDLATGINFNRRYRNLTSLVIKAIDGQLGLDPLQNVRLIRQQVQALLAQWPALASADVLKKTLQSLSCDADIVLDLHCDNQAVMHLYTGTPLAEAVEPLARLLGAEAVLLARASGDDPFDETLSRLWWELAEHFPAYPIPLACTAVTVELRGEQDVKHEYAMADCKALLDFLTLRQIIDGPPPTLPQARCVATPLEGMQALEAPHGGLLLFYCQPGERVVAGQPIAQLLDPISGQSTELLSEIDGCLFARTAFRHVQTGMGVASIAGATPFRVGNLLSL